MGEWNSQGTKQTYSHSVLSNDGSSWRFLNLPWVYLMSKLRAISLFAFCPKGNARRDCGSLFLCCSWKGWKSTFALERPREKETLRDYHITLPPPAGRKEAGPGWDFSPVVKQANHLPVSENNNNTKGDRQTQVNFAHSAAGDTEAQGGWADAGGGREGGRRGELSNSCVH